MAGSDDPLVLFEPRDDVVLGTVLNADIVDPLRVQALGDYVVRYVEQHPGVHLMLNFQEVGFLSSSTLTQLIRMKDAAELGAGSIAVCGLSSEVMRVFEITNLIEHLNVHKDENVDSAIDRFATAIHREKEATDWENRGTAR